MYKITVFYDRRAVSIFECFDWVQKFNVKSMCEELLVKYTKNGKWHHRLWVIHDCDYFIEKI